MHFLLSKIFSSMICLDFGVCGTLGSGDWVGEVILVLRTFPELVWRSVQILVEIGQAVRVLKREYMKTISQYA